MEERAITDNLINEIIDLCIDASDELGKYAPLGTEKANRGYVCYLAMRTIVVLLEDGFGMAYCDAIYKQSVQEVLNQRQKLERQKEN